MRKDVEALKPGGILVITTPYWGYLKNIVLALTNRTRSAFCRKLLNTHKVLDFSSAVS